MQLLAVLFSPTLVLLTVTALYGGLLPDLAAKANNRRARRRRPSALKTTELVRSYRGTAL